MAILHDGEISGSVCILCITAVILLCAGDPDLIDALVRRVMERR